jgi:hypothetical protein
MKAISGSFWCVLLACLVVGSAAPAASAAKNAPPNWKGSSTGTTRPEGGVHVDDFSGKSSHLGRFTASGFHVLNPVDGTFVGQATWTAANGDQLDVTYEGQVFPSGDPDFPYGFVARLVADGGTGRFARAEGEMQMTGAFTGVPGEFYFEFEGTLDLNGR